MTNAKQSSIRSRQGENYTGSGGAKYHFKTAIILLGSDTNRQAIKCLLQLEEGKKNSGTSSYLLYVTPDLDYSSLFTAKTGVAR